MNKKMLTVALLAIVMASGCTEQQHNENNIQQSKSQHQAKEVRRDDKTGHLYDLQGKLIPDGEGIYIEYYPELEAATDIFKEWSGVFKNGKLNGKGKESDHFGIREEGNYVNGKLVEGKISYVNGDSIEGCYDEDGVFAGGKGKKMIHGDGEDGFFKDGELTGKGKKTHHWSGVWEEGIYEHGELKGKGTITYPDGIKRKLNFKNGMSLKATFDSKHPFIDKHNNACHAEQGEYMECVGTFDGKGMFTGKGTIHFVDGSSPRQINLKNDLPVNATFDAKHPFKDKHQAVYVEHEKRVWGYRKYVGSFDKNGRLNGKGEITNQFGKVEERNFKDGKLQAKGENKTTQTD